jgi:serine/threonine protein kinase
VKPGNILIDNKNRYVHICRFRSSRLCAVDSTLTQQVGTPQHMTPDVDGDVEYDSLRNFRSIGCVFASPFSTSVNPSNCDKWTAKHSRQCPSIDQIDDSIPLPVRRFPRTYGFWRRLNFQFVKAFILSKSDHSWNLSKTVPGQKVTLRTAPDNVKLRKGLLLNGKRSVPRSRWMVERQTECR